MKVKFTDKKCGCNRPNKKFLENEAPYTEFYCIKIMILAQVNIKMEIVLKRNPMYRVLLYKDYDVSTGEY